MLYCKNGDLTVESEQASRQQLTEEIYEISLKSTKYQFNFQFSEDTYSYANRINLKVESVKICLKCTTA